MDSLIKVSVRKGVQSVSARDLYEKLGINERFSKWWERMVSYGFNESSDYLGCTKKCTLNRYGAEQNIQDYLISLDMAKEICMIQRSEIGKKFRQYFIEAEKRYREQMTSEYKQIRSDSKTARNMFTDTLKSHGMKERFEFINITKAMKKPLGITAKKSDMTAAELAKTTAAEYLARAMLFNEQGYNEVKPVCVDASGIVGNATAKRISA